MDFIPKKYQKIVNLFIMPPRNYYTEDDLGSKLLYIKDKQIRRVDFKI